MTVTATVYKVTVRECGCECVHRDTVTDDCVNRDSVTVTVYTVQCQCRQRSLSSTTRVVALQSWLEVLVEGALAWAELNPTGVARSNSSSYRN